MDLSTPTAADTRHELCFAPTAPGGCWYRFPCDAQGLVPLDALSERQRANYLFARAMVGRSLRSPEVQVADLAR